MCVCVRVCLCLCLCVCASFSWGEREAFLRAVGLAVKGYLSNAQPSEIYGLFGVFGRAAGITTQTSESVQERNPWNQHDIDRVLELWGIDFSVPLLKRSLMPPHDVALFVPKALPTHFSWLCMFNFRLGLGLLCFAI